MSSQRRHLCLFALAFTCTGTMAHCRSNRVAGEPAKPVVFEERDGSTPLISSMRTIHAQGIDVHYGPSVPFLSPIVLVVSDAAKHRILLVEKHGDSVPKVRVVYESQLPLRVASLSKNGRLLAFIASHSGSDHSEAHEEVYQVELSYLANSPKKLAQCEVCDVIQFDANSHLWMISRTRSKFATIGYVDKQSGKWIVWSGNMQPLWSSCYVQAALSQSQTSVLIRVSNELGWPECLASKLEGYYLAPLDAKNVVSYRIHADDSQPIVEQISLCDSKVTQDGKDYFLLSAMDNSGQSAQTFLRIDATTKTMSRDNGASHTWQLLFSKTERTQQLVYVPKGQPIKGKLFQGGTPVISVQTPLNLHRVFAAQNAAVCAMND